MSHELTLHVLFVVINGRSVIGLCAPYRVLQGHMREGCQFNVIIELLRRSILVSLVSPVMTAFSNYVIMFNTCFGHRITI